MVVVSAGRDAGQSVWYCCVVPRLVLRASEDWRAADNIPRSEQDIQGDHAILRVQEDAGLDDVFSGAITVWLVGVETAETRGYHTIERGKTMKKSQLKAISGAMSFAVPLKTCLFFIFRKVFSSSWSYFADNSTEAYRHACLASIAAGGGNALVALLSNGDPRAPVNLFEDQWGGRPNMVKLAMVVQHAKAIRNAGGSFWPCFFCDDKESAQIRGAAVDAHRRALGLLVTHLRPYCAGFILGIESSEYWTAAQHNPVYTHLKELAPDRYVGVHMQAIPKDGMPLCDFWAYEASWDPNKGDAHTGAELVAECQAAAKRSGKPIWPLEYNTNVTGARIKEQSRAVLAAGFVGCGGPV